MGELTESLKGGSPVLPYSPELRAKASMGVFGLRTVAIAENGTQSENGTRRRTLDHEGEAVDLYCGSSKLHV